MQNNSEYKKKITANVFVMFFCFIMQTLLGFAVRKVFVNKLGLSLLGYNAVFTNILTILNLTELGVGVAANAFLYKAFSQKNYEEVATISEVLKKIYRIIMVIILALGIIISIFLKFIIPDATDSYIYIYILYYLSLFSTVASYLIAYKKTIIIADQKNYVVTIIDFISYTIISFLQILGMYFYKSYILYLILNIIKFVISSIFIYFYYNKKYKNLNIVVNNKVKKEYSGKLLGQMKDIFVAKIGGAIFNGTDSIIISAFIGSNSAGLLSNYTLITVTLQNLLVQIFSSIQATLGNYMYSEKNNEKRTKIYDVSFFVAFILGIIAMQGIIFVLPNFISIFFGKEYVMSNAIAIFLGINLMLMTLLQAPNQIFTIYKLYKYDKYVISLSAILNIVISIILVYYIGVIGALIGTTVTLLIYLISRCYIIKKYVFINLKYILKLIIYIILGIGLSILIYKVNKLFLYSDILYGILLNAIFVVILSGIFILMCFGKSNEMKFLISKFFHKEEK